jgi:hypothetical protein
VILEAINHHLFVYPTYPFVYLACPFAYPDLSFLKVRMSGEHTELEKSVEEVLKNFMADKAMFEGV